MRSRNRNAPAWSLWLWLRMIASTLPMALKSGSRPGSGPSPQSSSRRRPSTSTTKAAGSLGPRPDTAIRDAPMGTFPAEFAWAKREPRSPDNTKTRQRKAFRRVVLVDHFHFLSDVVDVFRQPLADDRGGDQRTFVELNQRIDVGDL